MIGTSCYKKSPTKLAFWGGTDYPAARFINDYERCFLGVYHQISGANTMTGIGETMK